jgi:hypothetical protein
VVADILISILKQLGQPGLHSESLSQKRKKRKEVGREREKEENVSILSPLKYNPCYLFRNY